MSTTSLSLSIETLSLLRRNEGAISGRGWEGRDKGIVMALSDLPLLIDWVLWGAYDEDEGSVGDGPITDISPW